MKSLPVLLILGLTRLSSQSSPVHKSADVTTNITAYTVPSSPSKQTKEPVEIQSSLGYQFHTNDDEHLDQIVSSINAKIPSVNNNATILTPQVSRPSTQQVSGSHYGSQLNNFQSSQFLGYKKFPTNRYPMGRHRVFESQKKRIINQNRPQNPTKPIYRPNLHVQVAQRRVDSDSVDDEKYGENNEDDNGDGDGYRHEAMGEDDGTLDKPQYEAYPEELQHSHHKPEAEFPPPETKQSPFGVFPGSAPGFVGPAAFDPLPPPPAPLKGSVDYILIPLVLIGLAGPIFVVIYVILGAFEARLSPITRSLGGLDAYKPYLDNLMSSVGRALDKNECLDYAACQFGSLCNKMGYTDDPDLKKTLDSFTPHVYRRTVRKLFDSMRGMEECSIKKCLTF